MTHRLPVALRVTLVRPPAGVAFCIQGRDRELLTDAVRAGLPAPPGQHLCKVNPGGVIETEDGAEIWFDANGYGLRGDDQAEPSRYVLTMSLRFNTADSRYAWLNAVLGVWEGRFDERAGRASYTAYVPAK